MLLACLSPLSIFLKVANLQRVKYQLGTARSIHTHTKVIKHSPLAISDDSLQVRGVVGGKAQ